VDGLFRRVGRMAAGRKQGRGKLMSGGEREGISLFDDEIKSVRYRLDGISMMHLYASGF
jgi:hypothetical protein